MVPRFNCYQNTRGKAINFTITRSYSSLSNRGISTQVNALNQRIARFCSLFLSRFLLSNYAYFWIRSAHTGLLPTRPLLFTTHITLRSLFHGCLRDFLQFSLHCKKTTPFSMIGDWGNFSSLSILCQIIQWHMISNGSRLQ